MPTSPNHAYSPDPDLADPENHWWGRLNLSSLSQPIDEMENNILASAITMQDMPTDIETITVRSLGSPGLLEIGATLEAEDIDWAMMKLSGLALLATKKTMVFVEDIELVGGHLASDAGIKETGQLRHPSHEIGEALYNKFFDLQTGVIDGRSAKYS